MKVEQIIQPSNQKILVVLGQNIKLARLRRKLSTSQVAERAFIGRMTLYKIERGDPSVSMGSYLQVLYVLNLAKDLEQVAANDPLGRRLQDAGILIKKRAPKKQINKW